MTTTITDTSPNWSRELVVFDCFFEFALVSRRQISILQSTVDCWTWRPIRISPYERYNGTFCANHFEPHTFIATVVLVSGESHPKSYFFNWFFRFRFSRGFFYFKLNFKNCSKFIAKSIQFISWIEPPFCGEKPKMGKIERIFVLHILLAIIVVATRGFSLSNTVKKRSADKFSPTPNLGTVHTHRIAPYIFDSNEF